MPNIREFTNPVEGLKPDNGMEQVAARNAGHTEQAYAQMGQELGSGIAAAGDAYDKIKTQQDISHGLAASSQLQANLTTAWDVVAKNSDPNDHSTAEKFRTEQVEPALEAWTSSFSTAEGQAWATQHAGELRQHFMEKTAADQALMAGTAAVDNFHSFITGQSATVLQDPTSLNVSLGLVDTGLNALIDSNPNITPAQAASMKGELRDHAREEIGKSAFIGMARANPDAAMQALQDGKFNNILDGTTQNTMFGFAESIKREARADDRAQQAQVKEAQKSDFNTKRAALEAQLFQPDGSIKVPPNFHQNLVMLSQHPGAAQEPGAIEALGNAAARATTDQINGTFQRTDAATWQDLASRIGQPAGSPHELTHTQVNQAYASEKLSKADWEFLHQSVESSKGDPAMHQAQTQLNQAIERVKPLVGKSNMYGQLDQSGTANFAALHYDTYQRFQQLIAGGKSPAEAEAILENPRDPNGIMAHLGSYQTTNKQGMANVHNRVSAGGGPYNTPPPNGFDNARKPGESAADFLKRTGG